MEEKDIVMTQTGVEGQEVAAPETAENVPQPVERQPAARGEKDAYFADMRRKQRLEKARADNALLKQQIDKANEALNQLSAGSALAQADGENAPDLSTDTQRQDIHAQLEIYRQREVQRLMEDDLKQIQALDPSVTSLDDLPDMFLALRFNTAAPLSATQAFLAMQAIEAQTRQPKPASVGSIGGSGRVESEFFTSEEIDHLTSDMLNNPKVMEKAMRSLARIKK